METPVEPAEADPRATARRELRAGQAAGSLLGLAVLIASLRMDRLESQHINPYTVPGLLPALLGIVMMLLAALLALRSWRRGALEAGPFAAARTSARWCDGWRWCSSLCVGFGVVLVGHGLPFWLAAAIFVSAAIVALQAPPARSEYGRGLSVRDVIIAIVIGLGAGGAITLVFQQIFLVRLP